MLHNHSLKKKYCLKLIYKNENQVRTDLEKLK